MLQEELARRVSAWEQNGIRQHTPEWLEAKKTTIGGSSVATVLGLNPFMTRDQLVREKAFGSNFKSRPAMQWGNLFEDVLKMYIERQHGCVVLGEDLYVPGPDGIAYSPDGLAVMSAPTREYVERCVEDEFGESITTETLTTWQQDIVLLEFKCPWTRIPTDDAPKYYVPQVKLGMEILDVNHSCLIEGVFRRCSLEQVGANPDFNTATTKQPKDKTPIAFGQIGFYRAGAEPTENPIDYGAISADEFEEVLAAYDSGELTVKYGVTTDPGLVGILSWKLFMVNYHYIPRERGFLKMVAGKVQEIYRLADEMKKGDGFVDL